MKKRFKKWKLVVSATLIIMALGFLITCQEKTTYYSFSDFKKVPKTDVHLHMNSLDPVYMEFVSRYNFRVVSPNVDAGNSIDEQLRVAGIIKKKWPAQFAFFGTFSVDGFGKPGFADNTVTRIKQCLVAGASGIKIWKNIGMVLKDTAGRYVMVDDPGFNPIFQYLEKNKIPVMGHLGEPRNCWLPLSQMTDTSNYRYYKSNPQYHMYLHPEAPSYEDQINARDNLLQKFPGLIFTGAHLGSMEWNVDEVAKRLDMFPEMDIDLSARMAHVEYQSIDEYDKVRNFMIKYQDRIIYGTDITINANQSNPGDILQRLLERWQSNWIYLATDSLQHIKNVPQEVKGLRLPSEVIDKIYYKNANRFFE